MLCCPSPYKGTNESKMKDHKKCRHVVFNFCGKALLQNDVRNLNLKYIDLFLALFSQ